MPWSRRVRRPNDQDNTLRRHSTIDIPQSERRDEDARGIDPDFFPPDSSQSGETPPALASVTKQTTAVDQASTPTISKSLDIRDPIRQPQRFSLLRFKHASDPQLSKTAKSQLTSLGDLPPPMPPGKSLDGSRPELHREVSSLILI